MAQVLSTAYLQPVAVRCCSLRCLAPGKSERVPGAVIPMVNLLVGLDCCPDSIWLTMAGAPTARIHECGGIPPVQG